MAADKALRLAFILSATDKMSRVIDEAVKKSTDKLSSFERTTSKAGRSMMKAGTMVTAAGAAIGVSAFSMAKSTAEYSGQVYDMARATGVGIEAWQEMAYAAKMSGIEAEKLSTSLVRFDKLIVDAANGSKTAGQVFKDLGINLKDAKGNFRAPNEVFEDVADIFEKVQDGAGKTALAYELFGKSGAELIPMLNDGKAGLREFYAEAHQTGNVLTESAIKAADLFSDDLQRLSLEAQGAKLQLGSALIPVISELVTKFNDTIKRVTEWIKENPKLAETIGKVAVALSGLLIGVGTAMIVVGGLTFLTGKLVKALKLLLLPLKALKLLFLELKTGMLLFRIQYTALVVWQKIAAAAQWLFNTALYGCPVVWIIAAIMAVIAVVVLMVKYWDNIVAFFKRVWEGIKDIFRKAWEGIKNIWGAVTGWFSNLWGGIKNVASSVWGAITGVISKAKEGVQKAWGATKGFFSNLWGKVKSGVSAGWEGIKNVFLNYTPYGLIIKHWDSIAGWFSNLWGRIKDGISGAWDGIKNWFSNLKPVEWISGAWDSVGEFFTGLGTRFWEWGKNLISSLWEGIKSMVDKVVEGVKNVGRKIAGGFKSIFGINSPSKLFMEYGVNITEGLVMGLDEGGTFVERATEGLALEATRGAQQSISTNSVDASRVLNSTSGGPTITYAPNITIQGSATQETKEDFLKLLRQHSKEIVSMIERENHNKVRLSFEY